MADNNAFNFSKLIPGFDFLQNLSKGAGGTPMQRMASWVAPTMNVEELDKRIDELKAVKFWLDQNSRALSATIQALEVQKMTLATLQGMNLNMVDLTKAFQFPRAASADKAEAPPPAPAPAPVPAPAPAPEAAAPEAKDDGSAAAPQQGLVDAMQWWGSLTNQFQQIAATAMQDVVRQTSTARKAAAKAPARKAAAKKAPAKKAAAKKAPARKRA
ncbi:MAG: hypothetical protein QM740_09195 [Acidovorax sp.]